METKILKFYSKLVTRIVECQDLSRFCIYSNFPLRFAQRVFLLDHNFVFQPRKYTLNGNNESK